MARQGVAAPCADAAQQLAGFIAASRSLLVLTGAGCSTESGIPDYRSPGGAWSKHKPILFSEFVRSPGMRRRYWARGFAGWERFAGARPNDAHLALRAFEERGAVDHLITQNVDGLHQQAGSRSVVELHGSNHLVVCLGCGERSSRARLQSRMEALNPGWWSFDAVRLAPDGDTPVEQDDIDRFVIPDCESCLGMLKPAVVFFGENVPAARVAFSMSLVAAADALLVVGSSLTVWSGFRFARAAHERGIPIAILNIGPTRADNLATLKIEAKCGEMLPAVATLMC